jgi:hypothetical protein
LQISLHYEEYRAERQKIGDRKVRLITDFLAGQNSMSEDEARALAKEDFAIEKDTSELKARWYDKMTKVLSERTVARFFHIDEKLDAAADIALAANSHSPLSLQAADTSAQARVSTWRKETRSGPMAESRYSSRTGGEVDLAAT